jgi:DNA-binding winged helix-turn-helix (wHTH) protein/Flp pilus assembly protein TadD
MPLRDFDRLRFGQFEIDLGSGELYRSGRRVPLQERPFQLLTALVTSPGQLLKREELTARFWPGTDISDDDSLNTAVRKIRLALGDDARNPKYIETVGRRGYRFIMAVRPVANEPSPRRVSIGVLEIEELSQDAERNFTRGVIEEVIAQLSGIHSMVAIVTLGPRTSVDDVDVERARLQRRIDYILACSARKGLPAGVQPPLKGSAATGERMLAKTQSQVRVTAKLIRASDRSVRWAESFDYTAADLLSMPSEVAFTIAGAVLRSLGFGASAERTISPSAYEAFLKAEYCWKQRTPASLKSALELYKLAAQHERFPHALIGLAETHLMLALHGVAEPKSSLTAAREIARDLTQEQNAGGKAQLVLAWADMVLDRNWIQAEASFQKALQMAPEEAHAHSGFAYLLFAQGRQEEALAEIRRALNLEPLSTPLLMLEGVFRLFKGDCLGAEESFRRSLELEPNYELSLAYLGIAHLMLGEFEKALNAVRRAVVSDSEFAIPIAFHAFVASAVGKAQEARDTMGLLWSMRKRCYVSGYALAVGYLALEDTERAMEELERADRERSSWILFAPADPLLKSLRSDPRFTALVDRLGVPRP